MGDKLDCKVLEYQPKGSGLSLVIIGHHSKLISRVKGSELGSKNGRWYGLEQRHNGDQPGKRLL